MLELTRLELIPPVVVTVGGFLVHSSAPSPIASPTIFSNLFVEEQSSSTGARDSMVSTASVSSSTTTTYPYRGRQGSCTSSSTGRSVREWSAADNDGLRELCEAHPRSSEDRFRTRNLSLVPWPIKGQTSSKQTREERQRIKQELRDKATALKVQERALHSTSTIRSVSPASDSDGVRPTGDSFASSPDPQIPTPTKESIRRERQALKEYTKMLKEQEKAQKELVKLEKLKAAVAARNEKIDAHDRAQREKQIQKEALKKAKTESWNARARQSVEKIWGTSGFEIAAKSQVVRA